eukprot:TRINITY_DN93742_c0_g1_i1.p2 TRINITY_DN93742_c0_g1~~TRINITY_DN93742_c0_g1_i1.p2  ORF type:complete len:106 (+),score=12.97 TRINITY_DN93742_c0_g1_i1:73-390(+)
MSGNQQNQSWSWNDARAQGVCRDGAHDTAFGTNHPHNQQVNQAADWGQKKTAQAISHYDQYGAMSRQAYEDSKASREKRYETSGSTYNTSTDTWTPNGDKHVGWK